MNKELESKLVIVNDTGIKSIIFINILSLLTIGYVVFCVHNIINKTFSTSVEFNFLGTHILFSNPIIVSITFLFFLVFFILLLKKSISNPRKITVDFDSRTVEIQGLSILILQKMIPFDEIKSLEFFEKENYEMENGKHCWKKSIRITGILNEVLFNENVVNIINYDKLEELRGKLFKIDYRILKIDEES